jgi:hypothetical protein
VTHLGKTTELTSSRQIAGCRDEICSCTDHRHNKEIKILKVFILNIKITEIIDCSLYKERKLIEYLNILGSAIHGEREDLKDQ